jgi:F plasmid transfer operon protein TraF
VKKLNCLNGFCILMFGLLLLVSVVPVSAEEYPTLHRGVRPLGMGGAFTAVADDENALFYNPAGLSDISTLQMGIFNPLLEVSENTLDMISDAQDTDFDDTGEVTEFLRDYVGEHQHVRTSLFPHVGFNVKGYGVMVAGIAQATLDLDVRNPVWPEAHIDGVTDIGLLAGVGLNLPVTGLKAGASIKFISRESLDEVYTATDIASEDFDKNLEDDAESGSGIGLDLGAIYKLPFIEIFDLDVGLAVQNVPEMDMGDAKPLETQANFGLAAKKGFAGFDLVAAIDYMDLSNSYDEDEDIAKRLHMGAEVQLPKILSVRAGLNQGYYTAGATVDFKAIRLDVATYGEEVGAHAGQREDRRYIFQITIGW